MSDDRIDRAPTDEPDGTPAYAASLQAPGRNVQPGGTAEVSDDDVAAAAAPAGDDPFDQKVGVAGYDADATSGDTEIYRPD